MSNSAVSTKWTIHVRSIVAPTNPATPSAFIAQDGSRNGWQNEAGRGPDNLPRRWVGDEDLYEKRPDHDEVLEQYDSERLGKVQYRHIQSTCGCVFWKVVCEGLVALERCKTGEWTCLDISIDNLVVSSYVVTCLFG
jgi:hypothetical protein